MLSQLTEPDQRSAAASTAVEECLFLGFCLSSQRCIAMREAAETADDVDMQLTPADLLGVADTAKQCEPAFLVGQIFRVLERQVEELPVFFDELLIEAAADGAVGYCACQRVGGEGARTAAEHV